MQFFRALAWLPTSFPVERCPDVIAKTLKMTDYYVTSVGSLFRAESAHGNRRSEYSLLAKENTSFPFPSTHLHTISSIFSIFAYYLSFLFPVLYPHIFSVCQK